MCYEYTCDICNCSMCDENKIFESLNLHLPNQRISILYVIEYQIPDPPPPIQP